VVDETKRSCSYLAYLIRLRKVETENGPAWRVVLEDAHSTQRWGFADLPELYRFLNKKTAAALDLVGTHPTHFDANGKET
jgi:hypothetical protein